MASDEGTDDIFDSMSSTGYQPFTQEELAVNDEENRFLFRSVPYFCRWAFRAVSRKKQHIAPSGDSGAEEEEKIIYLSEEAIIRPPSRAFPPPVTI